MNKFDIYVHGTPRGHQIWGSEHSHDYISTFYNIDTQASKKDFLQIDVCGGDSFYTYLRHQNVYDVEGRPEAFFALTVGFRKSFCTNVYLLYQLFDAVYNQICIGSIIEHANNGEIYLVSELKAARSGPNATVDKIQAAFTQKIEELIVPTLQSLSSGDTYNRSKKIISLLEVDSPIFFDYFKKYSLIVSPNMQPASIAYETVSKELEQVVAQKEAISSSNEKLQSDITALTLENETLSKQLSSSSSSLDKKYKDKIDQLQSDLTNITNERNYLKQKIHDATSSIELMDQPFQKLTRLLAGRFPENSSKNSKHSMENEQDINNKNKSQIWKDWINSILLCLILLIGVTIIFLVLRSQHEVNYINEDEIKKNTEYTTTQDDDNRITHNVVKTEHKTEEIQTEIGTSNTMATPDINYDDFEFCRIDIKGGKDELKLNKQYTLSVVNIKTGKPANVPEGKWEVYAEYGQNINDGYSFSLKDQSYIGQNIQINYVTDGATSLSRVCKITK